MVNNMKHTIKFENDLFMYSWIQENFPKAQGDRRLAFDDGVIFMPDQETTTLTILIHDGDEE